MWNHPADKIRGPLALGRTMVSMTNNEDGPQPDHASDYHTDQEWSTPSMIPSKDRQEIRRDVVARVRWEIEQGIYDTPDKLESTLDQLLDEMDEQ